MGPIRLVTRARDIKLEQFTQSVELETERGDIEMTPGKLPLAAIEVRSGSGKIELLLPEKAAFHLEATAERGDAVNDFGPPIQKQSEGRSATLKGKVGDGRFLGISSNISTAANWRPTMLPVRDPVSLSHRETRRTSPAVRPSLPQSSLAY